MLMEAGYVKCCLPFSWFTFTWTGAWWIHVSAPMSDDILECAGRQGEGGADTGLRDRKKHAAAVAVWDAAADGDRRLLRLRDPDNGHHTRLDALGDT